jgi:hypothetical protein
MIGSTAFFAPEMRISPRSVAPPLMTSLSMATGPPSGLPAVPLGGRQRLQCQGVDLATHAVAERPVDHPVLLHHGVVFERGADDGGLEMITLAADGDFRIRYSGPDQAFKFT